MEEVSASSTDGEKPRIIKWEELQQEAGRLINLLSELENAKKKKDYLAQRIELLLQVRFKLLNRSNALGKMHDKLEAREAVMKNLSIRLRNGSEDTQNKKEWLSLGTRSLHVAEKALSGANIKESSDLLVAENAKFRLRNLQKLLRIRRQCLVLQVSAVYPLKSSREILYKEELHASSNANRSGYESGSETGMKIKNSKSFPPKILGQQLNLPPLKEMSMFVDSEGVQSSGTALGYVAHVMLLIASYLDVPVHYPVRFGGSRSYILDNVHSFEPLPADLTSNLIYDVDVKGESFPLFLDGQDTDKLARAIFLLGKDMEQLLNHIGVQKSSEPHLVLENLKQLLRNIHSQVYINSEGIHSSKPPSAHQNSRR